MELKARNRFIVGAIGIAIIAFLIVALSCVGPIAPEYKQAMSDFARLAGAVSGFLLFQGAGALLRAKPRPWRVLVTFATIDLIALSALLMAALRA